MTSVLVPCAGSIPASWRISQTVEAATLIPTTGSRRGFCDIPRRCSRAHAQDQWRIHQMVRGRPTRMGREILACRRAIKSRCQRSTVSGRTSRRTLRRTSRGSRCSRRRATPGQPRWSGLSRRAVAVREPRSGAAARGLNRLAGRDARYGRIAPASWPGSPFPAASTSKLPGGSLADPVIASVS
jgi:hypothetical protein